VSRPQLKAGAAGKFILRDFLGYATSFFFSESDGQSPEIAMTNYLSEMLLSHSHADATQRWTMAESRQRVTLLVRF
jgi:hypothetical protein